MQRSRMAVGAIGVSVIAGVASLALPALAQQMTRNLEVKIKIEAGCTLGLPTAVDFGTVNALGNAISAQGSVRVACTPNQAYQISLGVGAGNGATTALRKMTRQVGGTDTINYSLYKDAGHTQIWGANPDWLSATAPDGNVATIPVYGLVPIQTTPPAADYLDTVLVTLTL